MRRRQQNGTHRPHAPAGQALMLALFLTVLLTLTVLAVGAINHQLSMSSVHSLQKTGASFALQSGFSHASWLLGQSTGSWDQAMSTPPTAFATLGLDGTTLFNMSGNDRFTVYASTGYPAMPYEIALAVNAVGPRGSAMAKTLGFFSPETMTAVLPNKVGATAALSYFGSTPLDITSNLTVDWGPIINFSGDTKILNTTVHSPRKFAVTSINPYAMSSASPTDGKEYWAFSSLGECPNVFMETYKAVAQAGGTIFPPANPSMTQPSWIDLTANPSYLIDNFKTDPALSSGVIYVADSAGASNTTLNSVGINVQTIIFEGGLTLSKTSGVGGKLLSTDFQVTVPPDAMLDFPTPAPSNPAYTALALPACAPGQLNCPLSRVLNSAGTATPVDIVGFVYVKGDLKVTSGDWVIVGGMRVDGTISVTSPGASLHIIKDDQIAHGVIVDRMAVILNRIASPSQVAQYGAPLMPTTQTVNYLN